jgi:hypothetical protein
MILVFIFPQIRQRLFIQKRNRIIIMFEIIRIKINQKKRNLFIIVELLFHIESKILEKI